jgi:glutamate-ammonia-ligase adenylyltransferase
MSEPDIPSIPGFVRAKLDEHLDELNQRGGCPGQGAFAARIARTLPFVWACSEFVAEACLRDESLLDWLAGDGRLEANADPAWLEHDLRESGRLADTDAGFMAALRRYRRRHLVRIAWRDLAGLAGTQQVLMELSLLADACITASCQNGVAMLGARHGVPRGEDGRTLELLVLGMGKLGGRELNFSSDIDLVFLFPEHGETDGRRPISHEEFFARLAKHVARQIGSVTAEGFVYRVDLRLRPFGDSGPVAVSFGAFEDYLQNHGRDWERYAYVKAGPVFGSSEFAPLYKDILRPFVYRRYLDFSVFESLRAMKNLIEREVERRDLQENIKLGPGGIREIEFIVQAFQLIRGGRDPSLQTRSLLEALSLLGGQKLLGREAVAELSESYLFLRRVENRLQAWNDEQTHDLPEDDEGRARLALAMNADGWPALHEQIRAHRQRVSAHFQRLVFAPKRADAPDEETRALESILRSQLNDEERARLLRPLGLKDPDGILSRINLLRASGYYRHLDEVGRNRLQRLLPLLLREVAGCEREEEALMRVLQVLERIGGRTVYLALLHENAVVRRRLTELCAHSQFLSDQIAQFPLLLDELIDERQFESLPTRAELEQDLAARMAGAGRDDPERQVELLREFQRAALFRVAVPDLTGRLPLMQVSDRLTDIAELIVSEALALAWQQITARYGRPLCRSSDGAMIPAGMIVAAYGKFGGFELGYGSDLDLVFLHDSAGELQHTEGPQSIENSIFFQRLVQRLVHLLTVHSASGRLYEVDTRLRPSGKGGLLVQSIEGFAAYQRQEAWTWEHQALLRARAVAGVSPLRARFEEVRRDILQHAVHRNTLREDVRKMRERMRRELSKSGAGQFDLKQDAGGITDIEFLAQYWTLLWADRYSELVTYSDNIRQLESLASADLVPQSTVDVLTAAYRCYRQRMHHLSLDGASNVVPEEEFATVRAKVCAIWEETMDVD